MRTKSMPYSKAKEHPFRKKQKGRLRRKQAVYKKQRTIVPLAKRADKTAKQSIGELIVF